MSYYFFHISICLKVQTLFSFYFQILQFSLTFLKLRGHLTLVIMPRGQTKLKTKPNSFFPRFITHSISFSYKKCHLLSQSFPIFAYQKHENNRHALNQFPHVLVYINKLFQQGSDCENWNTWKFVIQQDFGSIYIGNFWYFIVIWTIKFYFQQSNCFT